MSMLPGAARNGAPAIKGLINRHFLIQALPLKTWHLHCSFAGTANDFKEQHMKMLIATMFKKVPVRTTKQRASICKRCGARIYSLSYLKAHLEAHHKQTIN
jgi:hypothetical protein